MAKREKRRSTKGIAADEEHHRWALKMWSRMDRDHSGSITRHELDCEEFRTVIRAALVGTVDPGNAVGGGATYARSQQNTQQAIDFLIRKSDTNHDGMLSFEEFESFTRCMRQKQGARHTAHLIFALFDVDGDQTIDVDEFREVYRYFLGHKPIEEEFQADWGKLDKEGSGCVTLSDYVSWLQKNKNPLFKQHAPPVRGHASKEWPEEAAARSRVATPQPPAAPSARTLTASPSAPDGKQQSAALMSAMLGESVIDRSKWNQRFNTRLNGNHEVPPRQRAYFSRPQSLPELKRFYDMHPNSDFEKAQGKLKTPELRRKKTVLSTETKTELCPERNRPAGRSPDFGDPDRKVKVPLWNSNFQDPVWNKPRYRPGSQTLRLPGQAPRWLYVDEYYED